MGEALSQGDLDRAYCNVDKYDAAKASVSPDPAGDRRKIPCTHVCVPGIWSLGSLRPGNALPNSSCTLPCPSKSENVEPNATITKALYVLH